MPKVKLTISIDEEIAKDLRTRSIEKYGNSRSFSQIIEDLATGSAEPAPPACQLGLMSDRAKINLEEFNKSVAAVNEQLETVKIPCRYGGSYDLIDIKPSPPGVLNFNGTGKPADAEMYYILKECMETWLNRITKQVCWQCEDLAGPLPTYPDVGHNFEKLYLKDPDTR